MSEQIRFDDGAAYERYMGVWSRRVGEAFLDWMAAAPDGRWLDVGCGNGAFTELILARCAPSHVVGIDPSEAQLDYARAQPTLRDAKFLAGDAMALPLDDNDFDVAVMPLVIFFVPDPAKGVAEMVRVVRPGGIVAAYAWDMPGGGFPYDMLRSELLSSGLVVPKPPSPEASSIQVLEALWKEAGLEAVRTHSITVQRTFADIDDYWTTVLGAPSVGGLIAAMAPEQQVALKERLRARFTPDASGRITLNARANAVSGRVLSHTPA